LLASDPVQTYKTELFGIRNIHKKPKYFHFKNYMLSNIPFGYVRGREKG
jgi:hypothetical protein